MKIVVVGGGVSGLYAACHLAHDHDVTLVEADYRLGGHADSHRVQTARGPVSIDSGFIVFNRRNYPLFSSWIDELGVASRPSDMSFSVSNRATGLEYNATDINSLFCQRRNLVRPAFLGMVRDILAFYRMAPALRESLDENLTLGQWLPESGFGRAFAEDHLLPMAQALWSAPQSRVRDFPVRYLLEFMANHGMLQLRGRPRWETIDGGSQAYVQAAREQFPGRLLLGTRVREILRTPAGVRIRTERGQLEADQVVLACHSDQALELLGDPSASERSILSAIEFQPNEVVLHNDATRLPANPIARASWNAIQGEDDGAGCSVSYSMNHLQGVPGPVPWIVSLNQTNRIDPGLVHAIRRYSHPVFTPEAIAAQDRWVEINGINRTWYCGAWWGWGFHEDGVRSARRVIDRIDASMARAA